MAEDMNEILKDCYSPFFIQGMKNRLIVSHFKYGHAKKTYPELAQALKCIKERVEMYEKTKNTEYLIDAANFCMLEFMYPSIKGAKFEATDSNKSRGLAGGISYKELMEVDE